MNAEKQIKNQIAELKALQPLAVTFKGKMRLVHFFDEETAESFNGVLETASESDTMKERHKREVRLLAIVLADLYRSPLLFRKVRRWFWEKRLSFGKYDEVEALQLLDTAVTRIQQGKRLEAYIALLVAEIETTLNATQGLIQETEQLCNDKIKVWKGVTA